MYVSIAELTFSNLTTSEWIERFNVYTSSDIPEFVKVNVTVNCSYGDREVSKDYGLFITYIHLDQNGSYFPLHPVKNHEDSSTNGSNQNKPNIQEIICLNALP